MIDYNFKGYDWTEVADYFGIKQEEKVLSEGDDESERLTIPEKATVKYYVNNTFITLETSYEEEVIREKLISYLWKQMDMGKGEFINNTREVLNAYLDALIEQVEEISYASPVLKGMRDIESDHTFLSWFTHNLESLWS